MIVSCNDSYAHLLTGQPKFNKSQIQKAAWTFSKEKPFQKDFQTFMFTTNFHKMRCTIKNTFRLEEQLTLNVVYSCRYTTYQPPQMMSKTLKL